MSVGVWGHRSMGVLGEQEVKRRKWRHGDGEAAPE